MKYDTISFKVVTVPNNNYEEEYNHYLESKDEEGWLDLPDKEFVYTELYFNGEKYGYHISEYSLLRTKTQKDCYTGCNGEVWYPDHEYSLFEPFTCSCGVSGCAGIWDGVHMKVRGRSVEWRMKKNSGYDFSPK